MLITPRRPAPSVDDRPRPRDAPSRRLSLIDHSPAVSACRTRQPVTTVSGRLTSGQTSNRGFSSPSWRAQPTEADFHIEESDEYNSEPPQRTSIGNFSRISPVRLPSPNPQPVRRSASCSAATRTTMRVAKVQRWAGLSRESSDWDGLRRDPELWFEDGDCLVHLYARGQSRRGPAFCVPLSILKDANCGSMFSLCFAQITTAPDNASRRSRLSCNGLPTPVSCSKIELFIPAPEDMSREAAFQWHITTRNFFAYVFGRPLVGTHMGQAFVDLRVRMHLFRSGQINNGKDFLDYAETQGYRDLVDCPDYALAMLFYAEHFKLRDVWIDAFAHCVGMNERLAPSREFAPLSRLTKALITRAYLEMDIQLGRVTEVMRNFLEHDMSPVYVGLPDGARTHLDRFRSFLHGFYVEKYGYWPPPRGSSFSKSLLKSMYFDFRNLYDYLVDMDSTPDLASQKPASGGICVLQNVASFDQRHKFAPLPHPLPLLPSEVPVRKRIESQKTLRTLTLGTKQGKTDRYLTARASLTSATNSANISVTSCTLVQAYQRFERQCALNHRNEKVSMSDARKVRWLLIYGTVQYLASAIRAPKEVRDADRPTYPLCCLVTEQSPWQAGTQVLTSPLTTSANVSKDIDDFLVRSNTTSSNAPSSTCNPIQPDCQTQDYFSHTNVDATAASVSVEVPAPLKISLSRRNSISRSIKRLSLPALGSRRNSMQFKATAYNDIPPHEDDCEAVEIHTTLASSTSSLYSSSSVYSSQAPSRQGSFTVPKLDPWSSQQQVPVSDTKASARTPTLGSAQMDEFISSSGSLSPGLHSSFSPSTTSVEVESPFWSDGASSVSSKSSTDSERMHKSSPAEESGLLGGLVAIGNPPTAQAKKTAAPSETARSSHIHQFSFGFQTQNVSYSELFHDTPRDQYADSVIGVALSEPSPPLKGVSRKSLSAKPSFDTSTRSLVSLDPMRDNDIDIFSALDLSPKSETPPSVRHTPSPPPRTTILSSPKPSRKSSKQQLIPQLSGKEKTPTTSKRRSLFGLRR